MGAFMIPRIFFCSFALNLFVSLNLQAAAVSSNSPSMSLAEWQTEVIRLFFGTRSMIWFEHDIIPAGPDGEYMCVPLYYTSDAPDPLVDAYDKAEALPSFEDAWDRAWLEAMKMPESQMDFDTFADIVESAPRVSEWAGNSKMSSTFYLNGPGKKIKELWKKWCKKNDPAPAKRRRAVRPDLDPEEAARRAAEREVNRQCREQVETFLTKACEAVFSTPNDPTGQADDCCKSLRQYLNATCNSIFNPSNPHTTMGVPSACFAAMAAKGHRRPDFRRPPVLPEAPPALPPPAPTPTPTPAPSPSPTPAAPSPTAPDTVRK
jgi:hypothetical protein